MSTPDFFDAPKPVDGDTPLSAAEWRIVAANFGDVLFDMDLDARFGSLDAYKKSVLVAVLTGLSRGTTCSTQAEIAALARCSVRCVRKALRDLEQHEILCAEGGDGTPVTLDLGRRLTAFLREFAFVRNPRIWRWSTLPLAERIDFTPAPRDRVSATPALRADRIADTPAPRADRIVDTPAPRAGVHATPAPAADPTVPTPAPGADRIADTPAPHAELPDTPAPRAGVTRQPSRDDSRAPAPVGAAISSTLQRIRISDGNPTTPDPRKTPDADRPHGPPSLIKKNKDLRSSSSSSTEGGPTPARGADPTPGSRDAGPRVDAATARRLALDALAAHFVRANPGIPLPRTCDVGDVRLVEACAANATWDADTLRQTHLDAIDGAFEKAPPDRPPTPRYIWGQFRFFLAHAALGRAKRLRAETKPKPKAPRAPEEPPASFEWLEKHMRAATDDLASLPSVLTVRPPRREFH